MNRIFRIIWSKARNKWVVVAEKVAAKNCCPSATVGALTVVALLAGGGAAFALDPGALPTGGQIVAGSGSIAQSGSNMTVTQGTNRMVANWNTFNIGQNAAVKFQQPNASSVALNRISDQNASQIMGSISANGQLFLINPSGIIFGNSARVDVGGLVASSLNMTNDNFMAGKYIFEKAGAAGAILNQGTIRTTDGGYVAFLGPQVKNEGTITANKGSVVMAAADKVTLDFTGDGLLSYSVEQGAIDALADNKGLIKADGGMVVMTAKAADSLTQAVVNNSGTIEAQTIENRGGRILLLSDMDNGTANVSGTLDASAPNGGNGGFIETSGAKVTVSDNAKITTLASQGTTGTWLIDPTDYTIAATGGDMTGAAVTSALASNNLTIQSTSGTSGTNGNINVADTISWSANTLTLNAINNIVISSPLNGSGTAGLSLLYGQGAVAAGNTSTYSITAPVNLASTGSFSTKLGSNGTLNTYTIITSLGVAADATGGTNQTLQGMARAANLSGRYVLGSNIDASPTTGWNSTAGFAPIGSSATKFTGTFDGLGHTITGLTINRSGTNYVGLFGYTGTGSTIRNVGLVSGSITGTDATGGLVGYNYDSTITNSYATGAVSGTGNYVGGLIGYNNSSTITNSYATGAVSGTNNYVGGLIGYNGSGSISNSYATGAVSGLSRIGGLLGYNWGGDSTISNSYSTGAVSGTSDYIGGLIGKNDAIASISNSYATGAVSGVGVNVGGLVGYNNGGIATTSFWDTETTGQATSALGVGRTTVQMKTASTFTGWDISTTGGSSAVWRIYEGYTYPLLRSFLTALTVTANNTAVTYNGTGYSGGNGVVYSNPAAVPIGTLTYGGSSQGAINAGSYAITPGGLYSGQQGYDISFVPGVLTINAAPTPEPTPAPAPTPTPAPTPGQTPDLSNILASIQHHINGTQEHGGDDGGDSHPDMEPGSGSGAFDGNYMGGLINDLTGYLFEEEMRRRNR